MPRKPKRPEDRIRDWPRLTVSIRDGVKRALIELSEHQNCSPWETVETAIRTYIETLPPKTRARMSEIIEAPDKRSERSNTVCIEVPKEVAMVVKAFVKLWQSPQDKLDRSARTFIAEVLGFQVPDGEEKKK